jgi:thiol-disulfide isomerase/thioredoxin
LEFPLKTFEGDHFDPLQTYSGKPILVIFYHTSCLGCTGRALPLAYELSKQNPKVQLIVVHVEFKSMICSKEDVLAIFTDQKPPFPIYFDQDAKNFLSFEAEGTPHWLLFNKNGNLTHSVFGSQDGAHNRLLYALAELEENEDS